MNVSAINGVNFCGGIKPVNAKRMINRKSLVSQTCDLINLYGPKEKRKAKWWVAAYTAGNTGIAGLSAQAGGLEEAALAGVEAVMTAHIFNGIYKFNLSKTLLESLATAIKGHFIGKTTFKLASKSVTWIPGIGNTINAAVAGTTTAALGAYIIDKAEEFDKARIRGEKIDDFIKKMGG